MRHGATSVGDFKEQVRQGLAVLLCRFIARHQCCRRGCTADVLRSHRRGRLQGTGAARFGCVTLQVCCLTQVLWHGFSSSCAMEPPAWETSRHRCAWGRLWLCSCTLIAAFHCVAGVVQLMCYGAVSVDFKAQVRSGQFAAEQYRSLVDAEHRCGTDLALQLHAQMWAKILDMTDLYVCVLMLMLMCSYPSPAVATSSSPRSANTVILMLVCCLLLLMYHTGLPCPRHGQLPAVLPLQLPLLPPLCNIQPPVAPFLQKSAC
jgi:hypothetical protein